MGDAKAMRGKVQDQPGVSCFTRNQESAKKNNFEITGLKEASPSLEKIWHKLNIKINKEGNEYSPIE